MSYEIVSDIHAVARFWKHAGASRTDVHMHAGSPLTTRYYTSSLLYEWWPHVDILPMHSTYRVHVLHSTFFCRMSVLYPHVPKPALCCDTMTARHNLSRGSKDPCRRPGLERDITAFFDQCDVRGIRHAYHFIRGSDLSDTEV